MSEWSGESRPVDPELEKASDLVAYRLERQEWVTFAEKMEGASPEDLRRLANFGAGEFGV